MLLLFLKECFLNNHPEIPAGIKAKSTKASLPVEGEVATGTGERMGNPPLVIEGVIFFSMQNWVLS